MPPIELTLTLATQEVLHDTRGEDGSTEPIEFDTGMGVVPEAVDMSVRLMTPEEISLVTAAAPYAYQGRADRPPVGPQYSSTAYS